MQKNTVTVIMPCFNEEPTVGKCVSQAKKALRDSNYQGEILVVDNGSTDRSVIEAKKAGARVIKERKRGYGAAIKRGVTTSKTQNLVMGDCDGTYNFGEIPSLLKELNAGTPLVLGSRFKGNIKKNAMPFMNRFIGNPLLTSMLNIFYGTKISDAHTGFRAFSRKTFQQMNIKSQGMELASEMIIKAICQTIPITEVPITYSKRIGQSKLSPIHDAWRHIQCILLYSPTYTFILPGLLFFLFGTVISIILLPHGQKIFGWFIDIHTMTVAILFASLGLQLILFGMFARTYTEYVLDLPSGPLARFLLTHFRFQNILCIGLILVTVGLGILSFITFQWVSSNYQELSKIREFIFATGLSVLGIQLIFSSFLLELFKER